LENLIDVQEEQRTKPMLKFLYERMQLRLLEIDGCSARHAVVSSFVFTDVKHVLFQIPTNVQHLIAIRVKMVELVLINKEGSLVSAHQPGQVICVIKVNNMKLCKCKNLH